MPGRDRLRGVTLLALLVCVLWTVAMSAEASAEASASATIQGRILDTGGAPVEGAEASLYQSADTRRPADFLSARTGSDGRYVLVVPAGSYWLVARVRVASRVGPLGPGDRHSGPPESVTTRAGSVVTKGLIVADLKEAARRYRQARVHEDYVPLHGRVLSAGGEPLADHYVVASRAPQSAGLPEYISGWTGADGRYTLYVLRGRAYVAVATRFPPTLPSLEMRELLIGDDDNEFDLSPGTSVIQ